MKIKLPILIVLTALFLSSCGSYHNQIRFSKVKKSSAKEIVSTEEVKTTDLEVAFDQAEETVFFQEIESSEEENNASEIEKTPVSRVDNVPEPILVETITAPLAEVAEDQVADEDGSEIRLESIKHSRNRAWLMTLSALSLAGAGIGITILFFTSAAAWIGIIMAIVGGYVSYGFLCKHLYQAAVDSRIHKYTRPAGDTSGNDLRGWNLAHIIIASIFGFGIPLIVLGVKLYEVKKKYRSKK